MALTTPLADAARRTIGMADGWTTRSLSPPSPAQRATTDCERYRPSSHPIAKRVSRTARPALVSCLARSDATSSTLARIRLAGFCPYGASLASDPAIPRSVASMKVSLLTLSSSCATACFVDTGKPGGAAAAAMLAARWALSLPRVTADISARAN
eukprot:3243803-Prymnesium_polylepis.1